MNRPPPGTFVVGNKLMGVCATCDKLIRLDKPILGSFHLCLTEEERAMKQKAEWMREAQRQQMARGDSLAGIGGNLFIPTEHRRKKST